MIIETERLILRRMTQDDYYDLCKILRDIEVMYAYNGAFSTIQTQEWLDKQLTRYESDGIGLYAVILKESSEMIGQCGLTFQEIPNERVVEIGYLFQKKFWHCGYAVEAARACRDYAFNELKVDEVYSIIRDINLPSIKVAERNGMTKKGEMVKHYRGVDMPHYIYSVNISDL